MDKFTDIESEEEYRDALHRFIELCQSQKDNDDLNELILLTDLMEKYERANCGSN